MTRNEEIRTLKRSALAASFAMCVCIGFATPSAAAQPPNAAKVSKPSRNTNSVSNEKVAHKCLSDLQMFHNQMQKDGYWIQGPGYVGYGYPMYGYGYGALATLPSNGPGSTPAGNGYQRARSGHDVRTLIAGAGILARRGQQRECEALLSATRDIYKAYTTDLRRGGVAMADVPGWRNQQIASAEPVTGGITSYSADQLVGTDVVNPQSVNLGSVDDVVLNPQTGKIDYLMIGRGGIFGIDEKFVPVPWEDFKATNGAYLLVLNTTKSSMDAAPQTDKYRISPNDDFIQESKKVDAYWKIHLSK